MSSNLQSQNPLVRADQLVCEDISGECVIYDGREKKAHHLNSTVTWIWHRCDGNASIKALAAEFEQQFQITNGLDVLMTGLEQLEARDLLEPSTEMSGFLADQRSTLSRRDVVVGGSFLMPLVVSILAPTPAAAKSKEKEKKK
jgi:hypothetical protein